MPRDLPRKVAHIFIAWLETSPELRRIDRIVRKITWEWHVFLGCEWTGLDGDERIPMGCHVGKV